MKIRYESLLPFYRWMWKRWRARRWERFRGRIEPQAGETLLDVGGDPSEWFGRIGLVAAVDVLNLTLPVIPERDDSPVMRPFAGDGRALPFPDQSYDIVYSNCRLASIHATMGNHLMAAKSLARAKEEAASFGAIQAELVAKLVRVTDTAMRERKKPGDCRALRE